MFTHTHIHTHTHTRVSARVSVSCAKTQIGKESMREPLSIAAFTRSMKLTYLQTHASVSICPTQVYSCTRNIHENPSAGCALPVHADLLPHTSPSLFNNVYPSQIHRCTRKVHETPSVACTLPVHADLLPHTSPSLFTYYILRKFTGAQGRYTRPRALAAPYQCTPIYCPILLHLYSLIISFANSQVHKDGTRDPERWLHPTSARQFTAPYFSISIHLLYLSQIHRCTRKVHETLSIGCALPVHTSGVWS